MKNLKINSQKIKALIGSMILVTNLSACSIVNNNSQADTTKTTETAKVIDYLLLDNKLVPVSNISLMDSNKNIITKIDGVIIDNEIKNITNPIEIMFTDNISGIIINNEIFKVSEFTLVDKDTKEELKNIKGAFINNELIPLNIKGDKTNTNDNNEEHKILTDEEFYNLVDDIYNKLTKEGLPVTKEEVTKYLMIVNIDQLKEENKELVNTIIGEQDPNEVILDTYSLISRIITENNSRWCAKGLGWDKLLMYLAPDAIFSETEKSKTVELGERVRAIVETGRNGDKDKFNELLNKLLMDMIDAKEDNFKLESGNGFNDMYIYINFIRINFLNELDKTNGELIKYFVVFDGDGLEYEQNAKTSEYWSGINYLINECHKSKTLTK